MSLRISQLTMMASVILATSGALAQEATGLKVGSKAPDFTLKDQEGKDRSLGEMLGKDKVALIFYRSADW
ncbi:hypothetical protein P12x_002038 [Tundrisphaera lichenicola]|uniref:hypothetical protein n=1 Tax=Tundrisphaera lichenicola TaxID=2029860 RepID=UPI003EC10DE1